MKKRIELFDNIEKTFLREFAKEREYHKRNEIEKRYWIVGTGIFCTLIIISFLIMMI